MPTLDEAVGLWDSARKAYEDALGEDDTEGAALDALREGLHDAERAIDLAFTQLTEATTKQLASLRGGLAAKVRVQEHHALEAERSARHGELAGAGHDEQEAISRLEGAAETLSEVMASLREVAENLEGS